MVIRRSQPERRINLGRSKKINRILMELAGAGNAEAIELTRIIAGRPPVEKCDIMEEILYDRIVVLLGPRFDEEVMAEEVVPDA